jgi:hypothetical protein
MEDYPELKRLIKWIVILFTVLLGSYLTWGYYRIDNFASKKEAYKRKPYVDYNSISEMGYIQEKRIINNLNEGTKTIIWFVKIPATNEIYSCDWQGGYYKFKKDDAVILIHKKDDVDEVDFSGFIIGMHGEIKGKSAQVWVLNSDIFDIMDY